eukprot:4177330-Amphidinium_carterae.1
MAKHSIEVEQQPRSTPSGRDKRGQSRERGGFAYGRKNWEQKIVIQAPGEAPMAGAEDRRAEASRACLNPKPSPAQSSKTPSPRGRESVLAAEAVRAEGGPRCYRRAIGEGCLRVQAGLEAGFADAAAETVAEEPPLRSVLGELGDTPVPDAQQTSSYRLDEVEESIQVMLHLQVERSTGATGATPLTETLSLSSREDSQGEVEQDAEAIREHALRRHVRAPSRAWTQNYICEGRGIWIAPLVLVILLLQGMSSPPNPLCCSL